MTTFQRSLSLAVLGWLGVVSGAHAQGYRELVALPWLDTGVDLFAIDSDASIEHRFQREPDGGFAAFEDLPGVATDIAAVELADGRFEVFIVDQNESLWHSLQPAGSWDWSAWELLDEATKKVSVARAANGRVELFVIGSDDVVWHRGRASDDEALGPWTQLELSATQLSASAADGDGFELAVIGSDDLTTWQLSFDGNAELSSEPQNLAGESYDVTLARLPGGGHSLITVGTGQSLWERRRTSGDAGWSDWQNLTPTAQRVSLAQTSAGLELFALGAGDVLSRSLLTAADGAWSEAQTVVEASPLDTELRGRARLIITSLDVDQDVPVRLGLRFSVDRSRVDVTSFPTVVTERFDTPFGGTNSTISLPSSSQGELLRDEGVLRLPVTLRFDQSLNIPLIEEDGNLSLVLSSDAPDGQLLDSETGTVALSGTANFDGDGSTNPLDGQSCTVIVTGTLSPAP
jgi:hypothetical protein